MTKWEEQVALLFLTFYSALNCKVSFHDNRNMLISSIEQCVILLIYWRKMNERENYL